MCLKSKRNPIGKIVMLISFVVVSFSQCGKWIAFRELRMALFAAFAYQLTHFGRDEPIFELRPTQHSKNQSFALENEKTEKKILNHSVAAAHCQLSLIARQAKWLLAKLLEICIQSERRSKSQKCLGPQYRNSGPSPSPENWACSGWLGVAKEAEAHLTINLFHNNIAFVADSALSTRCSEVNANWGVHKFINVVATFRCIFMQLLSAGRCDSDSDSDSVSNWTDWDTQSMFCGKYS